MILPDPRFEGKSIFQGDESIQFHSAFQCRLYADRYLDLPQVGGLNVFLDQFKSISKAIAMVGACISAFF
jgi:hypothetical protein